MGKMSKLRRVQDLFTRGEILAVEKDGEVVDTFWVAKLNTFDRQEVLKDAQTGRVRAMVTMDRDEDEQLKIAEILEGKTDEDIALDLSRDHQFEHLNKARAEVTTNPDWKERLEILENQELEGATEEELAVANQIAQEYQVQVMKEKEAIDIAFHQDLLASGRPALEREYRKSYRAIIGSNAWHEYKLRSEVVYALRDCSATRTEDGWDHSGCGFHAERILDQISELEAMPDHVLEKFQEIWTRLEMSEDEAGKSAAPSASSGS